MLFNQTKPRDRVVQTRATSTNEKTQQISELVKCEKNVQVSANGRVRRSGFEEIYINVQRQLSAQGKIYFTYTTEALTGHKYRRGRQRGNERDRE